MFIKTQALNETIQHQREIDAMEWDIMEKYRVDWIEVRISWKTSWNEACAWALEQFGLPGDRYVTNPSADSMTFLFRHREDAVLMILRWS